MHQLATFFECVGPCLVLLMFKDCMSVRGQSTVGGSQNELVCGWDNEYVQSLVEQTRGEEQRRHDSIIEAIKTLKDELVGKIQDATATGPATNQTSGHRFPFGSPSTLSDNCVPLLIQQNVDGSGFFNRSWQEFKVGFNGTNGNYWLGNEMLHQLTKDARYHRYKLRFELQQHGTGAWFWAEYTRFVVYSEAANYELSVGGYSSNTGNDALGYQDKMMFTTWDRKNDLYRSNCAVLLGGGFWYKDCHYCGVNVMRSAGQYFWHGLTGGRDLQTTRMWLLCR